MTDAINIAELKELSVSLLKGVGAKRSSALAGFEVESLFDLLTYYPRRYIDRTKEAKISEMIPGSEASLLVTVEKTDVRRIRGGKSLVTSTVTDGTALLKLTFFNQNWRQKQLVEGRQAMIYGKVDLYRGQRQMTNPVVDLVGNRTGRVIPVYPQSEKSGLHTWDITEWVAEALRRTLPPKGRGFVDPLSDQILSEHDLVSRDFAFRAIHQPENMFEVTQARKRLIFDELFRMQLALVLRKRAIERTEVGAAHQISGPLIKQFKANLPFELTGAQVKVIGEIEYDLARSVPMHRLLQGDVGAGKTLVAVAAMLTAVDSGHQAALMAPTEVLAEQHLVGIRKLLDGMTVTDDSSLFKDRPIKVELLSNRVSTVDKKRILSQLLLGEIDIAIGTHALIQESVSFDSLGVVVIDEQHRFGVEQRSILREKSRSGLSPDMLVMTATPIPRTAAMTVYGDLDVSILDELPPGRTPIDTKWVRSSANFTEPEATAAPEELDEMWDQVRAQVSAGRQVYIVCPLIDESEKLSVASAEETYEYLQHTELSELQVGLLHGRISPADKDLTMDSFRAGKLDVLVATTVIEVGVDVPNATIMVILDADRFGIAQLHQLRGRVGRGSHRSQCWLVSDPTTPEGEARMAALVASTDGFELAEVDLDLRGEGTILGERQKGRNDLKLASLRRDRNTVVEARNCAIKVVDSDPGLESNEHLASELESFLEEGDAEFLLKN